jgi:proton-translocating NADH-quinone oxidoreductase chain L
MYIILVFLPLIGSLICLIFGRFLGKYGASFITTFLVFFSCLLSIFTFYEVALSNSPCYFTLMPWINSGMFTPSWGFYFDTLTVVMLVVITTISFLVHLFSTEYMSEDPYIIRFLSYISLFTFFMIILVTGDNFIQLFVGWEGVGLCSYLLINFWFTRLQANKAAIKAMVVNRVGDLGLALGIFIFFTYFKSVDFSVIFSMIPLLVNESFNFFYFDFNILTLGTLFLFVGAVGKSAQLGLHTWLPDAMEGPTPVSALIHAATMVTAGVFLLARCSAIFEYCPTVLIIITIVGALTAFFGATTALVQNDIKKVISYSTCSKLGYMIFICGLSHYSIGVFHLFNHAFFKALLFLIAGSIIHAMSDEQDFRKMGGLRKVLPFSYSAMVIGSFSLMGFPFLTGFYSKDAILEISFAKYCCISHFSYFMGSFTAFFTSFYSIRLIYLVFIVRTNSFKSIIKNSHEPSINMYFPLIFLLFGSIFFGFFFKDMFIGLGSSFWGNALFVLPMNSFAIEGEFLPTYIKLLPNLFVFGGVFLGWVIYSQLQNNIFNIKIYLKNLYIFLNKKWFFDKLYNEVIGEFFLNFVYNVTYKNIDKGFLEVLGPKQISNVIFKISSSIKKMHNGFIIIYAFNMILCLILCFYNFFFEAFFIFILYIFFKSLNK